MIATTDRESDNLLSARARQELRALFQNWHLLTDEETAAIQVCDWQEVQRCQSLKQQLQDDIVAVRASLRSEAFQRQAPAKAIAEEFRGILNELVALEASNLTLLSQQRERANTEMRRLDCASRNLRQVRSAYAAGHASVWHSYS